MSSTPSSLYESTPLVAVSRVPSAVFVSVIYSALNFHLRAKYSDTYMKSFINIFYFWGCSVNLFRKDNSSFQGNTAHTDDGKLWQSIIYILIFQNCLQFNWSMNAMFLNWPEVKSGEPVFISLTSLHLSASSHGR